ncbi:MAG: O-antigen ligase like membrane protein [Rhodobacteraceae bacterium HLUCCA24]|nr:MAG: O-antigen ligase like membrane protein [Rhodobacteraceae bacterium HLUCCA24]
MPNAFAQLMLLIWPLVMIVLFRKLPADRAIVWGMIGAYLILPPAPAGFDFPLLPPLTKDTMPALVALVAGLALARPTRPLLPESLLGRVLLGVFLLSPFPTVLTNAEPLSFGTTYIRGLQIRDALGLVVQQFLLVLPFLVARQYLFTAESQRVLLIALVAAALVYTLPVLIELRMSPQLNTWVYGWFQHSFAQMVRGDGYRPIVFLYHALWLSFFMVIAAVAAAGLLKTETNRTLRALWLVAMVWLAIIVVLAKGYASILYAMVLLPLVLLLGARAQIAVAACIALLAISYPVVKGADMVPTDAVLSLAERIEDDRAGSLRFRFDNEEILQEKVDQKPLFGWGSWGRNHVYNEDGRMITITDGRWIITMGVYGWVGFLAEVWLLALPIFMIWRESRRDGDPLPPYAGPLALLLAVNLFDMIPNATLTPLTWLIAGSLWGMAEERRARAARWRLELEPVWRSVM